MQMDQQRMGNDGRGGYGRGPPGGPEIFDKKMSKTAYDRRQSKLPPRLAKQREVSRAQARGGPGQLSPGKNCFTFIHDSKMHKIGKVQ